MGLTGLDDREIVAGAVGAGDGGLRDGWKGVQEPGGSQEKVRELLGDGDISLQGSWQPWAPLCLHFPKLFPQPPHPFLSLRSSPECWCFLSVP